MRAIEFAKVRSTLMLSTKSRLRSASRITRSGTVLPLDRAFRVYGGSDKWLHGYGLPYRHHLGDRRFHHKGPPYNNSRGVGWVCGVVVGGVVGVFRDGDAASR